MTSVRTKKCLVFGFGIGFAVFATIFAIAWPFIYNAVLKSELVLTPDSMSYNFWIVTPIPMYMEIYLFDWINYKEFEKDRSIKPQFEERGPYIFEEKHYRENLVWNPNGTVTFEQKRVWHFDPTKSNGTLDDKIVNINVIAATVAYYVRNQHWFILSAVDWILKEKGEGLATIRTVRELLFDGYEDEMLDMLHDLNITAIKMPYDKFGWFYPRNESITYDGIFNMFTGSTDFSMTGVMDRWDYVTETNYYDSPCNMVNGTTGELWPPVNNDETVTMFITDICRSMNMEYKEDAEVLGITGRKYIGTDEIFDNGTKYPDEACFTKGERVPSGSMNVSECRFGAPAFVSYPHFYLADDSYRQAVDGMKPNETEHQMYLILEPKTGIPLDVRAQLQINIMIQTYPGLSLFHNLTRMFIPTLWFRETAQLSPKLASAAKVVVLLPSLGEYTFIGIGCIGILIILTGIFLSYKRLWGSDVESPPLLENEEVPSG